MSTVGTLAAALLPASFECGLIAVAYNELHFVRVVKEHYCRMVQRPRWRQGTQAEHTQEGQRKESSECAIWLPCAAATAARAGRRSCCHR
jgi:hypothetical protein